MVVTIGTLVSAHDLAFRVYATSKAADSAGKIDRTEDADVSRRPTIFCVTHFLPTEQETMQMAIGSAVTSYDRALVVNPVGIRNATPEPAAGGNIGVGAREIKGVEFPIAHQKAVQVETSRVDVTAHDFASRVDPEAEGVAGTWEIDGHERSSAHQNAMEATIHVHVSPHHVALLVDPVDIAIDCAWGIDCGKAATRQQESVGCHFYGIDVLSDDLAPSVHTQGFRVDRSRKVNRREHAPLQ